jgi:hypothetical protein
MTAFSYQEARDIAAQGELPPDFDQWALANDVGWTVAHVGALHGNLPVLEPDGFNQWSLADNKGWTVAHEAARYGGLPADFDQWALVDNKGRSVAHEAALSGKMPAAFDMWDMVDQRDMTVAKVAITMGFMLESDYLAWKIRKTLDSEMVMDTHEEVSML